MTLRGRSAETRYIDRDRDEERERGIEMKKDREG